MEIRYELGKRIRQYRCYQKLSQEKLAEMSGLNTIYISEVERGIKNASIETIYKISRGLGINIRDLFNNIDSTASFNNEHINNMNSMMMGLSKQEQKELVEIISRILKFKR